MSNWKLHIARGCAWFASTVLYSAAFSLTDPASGAGMLTVYLFSFIHPVALIVANYGCRGQKVSLGKLAPMSVMILAVLLACFSDIQSSSWAADACALFAGITFAASNYATDDLNQRANQVFDVTGIYPCSSRNGFMLLTASFIGLLFVIILSCLHFLGTQLPNNNLTQWKVPEIVDAVDYSVMGTAAFAGNFLYIWAIAKASAADIAFYDYLILFLGAIFDVYWSKQSITYPTVAGAVLICIGGSWLAVIEYQEGREKQAFLLILKA